MMDDPWGSSPWASDTPATLELPTAPQSAHFAAEHTSPRRPSPSPRRSPWNDDESWGGGGGGWNDASSGKESPRWGRSPGLKPLDGLAMAEQTEHTAPEPWGGLPLDALDTSSLHTADSIPGQMGDNRDRDIRIIDSAISLGEDVDTAEAKFRERQSVELMHAIIPSATPQDDAWAIEQVEPKLSSSPASPLSPSISTSDAENGADESRQPSKVQELVVMFDGIAKRSTSPATVSLNGTKQPWLDAEQLEDDEDKLSTPDLDDSSPLGSEDDSNQNLGSSTESLKYTLENGHSKSEDVEVTDDPGESKPVAAPTQGPPPVAYSVDLSKLDELFPSTETPIPDPEPVPDVIIDDTFTTIDERKAWYRLSRLGSRRKYDSGDDENYVRATWSDSVVREKTIKIVRRWMEEDSIGGGAALGRRFGASGANLFNWNSSAPQVEIGELLKRSESQSRPASIIAGASPTAAAFGWASDTPSSPVIAILPPPTSGLHRSATPASPMFGQPSIGSLPPPEWAPARTSTSTLSSHQSTNAQNTDDDDDDDHGNEEKEEEANNDDADEWGEMVSSAAVPEFEDVDMSRISPIQASGHVTAIAVTRPAPPPISITKQLSPIQQDASSMPVSDPWDFGNWDLGSDLKPVTPTLSISPSTPLDSSFPAMIGSQTLPIKNIAAIKPSIPIPAAATAAAAAATPPLPPKADLISEHDQKLVMNILQSLPDLSYMLT